ncbi:MAG: hypothetical protein ABJF50_21425 [Paracoccaceae bacterium]
MSTLQLFLILGALWVWLGFNLSNIRDRHFPGVHDWVLLVFWFLMAILPIAFIAWKAGSFRGF